MGGGKGRARGGHEESSRSRQALTALHGDRARATCNELRCNYCITLDPHHAEVNPPLCWEEKKDLLTRE